MSLLTTRSTPWLLLATLALLGLMSMHGVGGHHAMAPSSSGAESAHTSMPAMAQGSTHGHTDPTAARDPHGPTQDPPLDASSLVVAVCLAVLVAAATAIRRRASGEVRWWRVLLPRRMRVPLIRARHHDPPDLFALSILRC